MEKFPDTKELLECMNRSHKCLETYVQDFMDYALDAGVDMEPGIDLVRLLVSLECVIKRLSKGDPVAVFRSKFH